MIVFRAACMRPVTSSSRAAAIQPEWKKCCMYSYSEENEPIFKHWYCISKPYNNIKKKKTFIWVDTTSWLIGNLRRLLLRKDRFKIEIWVMLIVAWLFHIGHDVWSEEVSFQLICWRSGLHIKAENERLTAVALRCRQNFKFDNSAFFFLFVRINQRNTFKYVQHVLCTFNLPGPCWGFVVITDLRRSRAFLISLWKITIIHKRKDYFISAKTHGFSGDRFHDISRDAMGE